MQNIAINKIRDGSECSVMKIDNFELEINSFCKHNYFMLINI